MLWASDSLCRTRSSCAGASPVMWAKMGSSVTREAGTPLRKLVKMFSGSCNS